jgi:uncharacterized membrane protein YhaH (DUF805 family)
MKIPSTLIRLRWSRFAGPAVILLAAAVAVAPQLLRGNSCGHDFDFHLVSWFDCLNSWRQGIAYPHWAASANFGAGEPRFVFYPPLTWMLGAALGLILPWQFVPMALTILLLAGTGLGTRALARQALPDSISGGAATLAGCAAIFSGYALFCAYERAAFGEMAGGFLIPLLLLLILRQRALVPHRLSPTNGARNCSAGLPAGCSVDLPVHASLLSDASPWRDALNGSAAPLALLVAGCWLSNVPLGVMGCYLLAAAALAWALLGRSWTPLLRAAIGAALGTALAGIFLLPAAWEQRWVDVRQAIDDPGLMIENSWLFACHADPVLDLHDVELWKTSILAVTMIAVALGGLVICWRRGRLTGNRRWWVLLALIPLAVLFLQFPLSQPVWNLLPKLRFLQFPWRWLVILEAPMAIFFAGAVWPDELNQKPARRWMRVGVAAACAAFFLAATVYAGRAFFQVCDSEDAVFGMAGVYQSGAGFAGADEYAPPGADNSIVATGLPDACLAADPSITLGDFNTPGTNPDWWVEQGTCEARLSWRPGSPEHMRLSAVLPHPGFLILRLRSYPAWRVQINGRPVASLPQRDDGLIVVPVEPGTVFLSVDWIATPDTIAGRWLSGLAVLALTGLWLGERKLSRPRLS